MLYNNNQRRLCCACTKLSCTTSPPLHSQLLTPSTPDPPPILPRARTRKQSPLKLMRSQLEVLFHDVIIPVRCVRYLLDRNHLSADTAQLILTQESDLESWDILLTSLENHGGPEETLECFKEALSFAVQVSLLERIEVYLHHHSKEDQLTHPTSRPSNDSALFANPRDEQPFAGKVSLTFEQVWRKMHLGAPDTTDYRKTL